MPPSNRSTRQDSARNSNGRKRLEFVILALLLIPLAGSAIFFTQHVSPTALNKPSGTTLGQRLLQGETPQGNKVPYQAIPSRYKTEGTVDDRYTLATDPQTGETLINDSLGSIGTNNTSIDGDRARLARDMVNLENYLREHRGEFSSEAYNWLKKVTRTGMKLAFGTPGLIPSVQPAIKADLLAEFHDISANPTDSILSSGKYLEMEKMFQRPEDAYLAQGSPLDTTNFLILDPIGPTRLAGDPYTDSNVLTKQLATLVIEPSLTDLSVNSAFNYMNIYSINTVKPTSLTTTLPVSTTSNTTPSSTTTSNTSPTKTTVADYYASTLGVKTAPTSSTTTSTGQTSPISANITVTTSISTSGQVTTQSTTNISSTSDSSTSSSLEDSASSEINAGN